MNDDAIRRATELAGMLADPLRLRLLQALMAGPAPVTELIVITGAGQSNVSNHLKVLRDRGLVAGTRQGRQITYELADAGVGQLVQALTAAAGGPPTNLLREGPLLEARTCYDHLAGRLGVSLYNGLVHRGAIIAPAEIWGEVEPGPAAPAIFERDLGLDLSAVASTKGRRRFAYTCPDWSSGAPHLGGALAAAIHERLKQLGWITRDPSGTRALQLTSAGEQAFSRLVNLS